MDLYLVPNNLERTVLVSPNGVAHYQVRTSKPCTFLGPRISRIQRPADSLEESIVADVEWRNWGTPAVDFLYRRGRFSSARYFIGNDSEEYCWKMLKGAGLRLTHCRTAAAIAQYTQGLCGTGIFRGEIKSCLRILPCALDIDIVVLSFMIMEKKRRDHLGDGSTLPAHDEDPQGDGGAEAGAG